MSQLDNQAPKDWKHLDDFRDGLTGGLQGKSDALAGLTLTFSFPELSVALQLQANESVCELRFNQENRQAKVTVFNVAKDVYFLGCAFLEPKNEDICLIFSRATHRALAIHAVARSESVAGEERVVQSYHVGALNGKPPTGFVPCPTNELTGQRLLITYDANHAYEQIFINAARYCWHCVKGEQYGHAASERCTYYKFDDGLYMYSWRELFIPCGTTYFLNYHTMIATGKFIGWTADNEISHSYAGGEMQILSKTTFPADRQPLSMTGG